MAFDDLTRHLRRLLRAGYLYEDAKRDIEFMLRLHSSGEYRLDHYSPIVLLYPFLTNPHSPAGMTLRSILKGFSGDLLQRLADEYDDDWYDKMRPSVPYPIATGALRRASEYLHEPLHSGDLLTALMVYPMDPADDGNELDVEREKRLYALLRSRKPLTAEPISAGDTEIVLFLEKRGLDVNDLAMRLRDYASSESDIDHVGDRFSLAVRLLASGRIKVEIVERWGEHEIAETEAIVTQQHGLWLPETVLFLPAEIEEFESLLNATSPVREIDYQKFFESHPKWLGLLGEQYEATVAEIDLPPLQYRAELALCDGPLAEMTLRPDFLLKRIGLDLWDVLDIKPSAFRTVVGTTGRRKFSECVAEAVAQLREYHYRLQQRELRAYLRRTHKLNISEPLAMVLIGRDFDFRSLREKSILTQQDRVRIYTYDDLHRLARHRRLAV